jgi:two-component system, NarL family, sensor kinase
MYYSREEAIIYLISTTIFILVMVTFIIKILFFVQKKQKRYSDGLLEAKTKHERELHKAQSEIQEQIFQEIAREIHDNVGQILSLAKLGLSTIDLKKREETENSIIEISDILEKALDDLRHISRSLNTEIIKKGGLKKSIEMQVGYIQRGGKFNTQLEVCGEPVMLIETKEMFLFRIAQEAINNIIRHSKATEISIFLGYGTNSLELKICDNGKGFILDDEKSKPNHISGLCNMEYRAKLIEAEFTINSQVGKGTCISVKTPY